MATRYVDDNNLKLAGKYVEKLLNLLIESKGKSFKIRGDEYFNQIDKWLDENLLLSTNPNRSDDMIARSYLFAVTDNVGFKEIIEQEKIKNLLRKFDTN